MSQVQRTEILTRADQALRQIVDLFNSQELPAYCAKALIDAPEKPSSNWSLGNQIIMLLNGTTDARGFDQWKKVGRYIKSGTHGFDIFGHPIPMYRKNPLTGKLKDPLEFIGNYYPLIRVHPIENTEGKDLPVYKPRTIPPLVEVAEKWGLKIQYERLGRAYGVFQPGKITLATEDIGTFFHELAHAAHNKIETLKDGQDPEQEAIAQLSSCVISRIYGFDNLNYTYHYIASYAKGKSPKTVGAMCQKVLGKVQKIVNSILIEAS